MVSSTDISYAYKTAYNVKAIHIIIIWIALPSYAFLLLGGFGFASTILMYELLLVKLVHAVISSCKMAVVVLFVAADHWLHCLDQTFIKNKISESVLASVAREISGIIIVGKFMGFTESKIKQYQEQCPYCVKQQFTLMFSDWLKHDTSATVEKFVTLMSDDAMYDNLVRNVITRVYSDYVNNGVLQLH